MDALMFDIGNIPFDDADVWRMICEGRTKGCFQIESHLGKTWCKKIKPTNIEELADVISLIRPGCVSADTRILLDIFDRKDEDRPNSQRFKKMKISDLFKMQRRCKTSLSRKFWAC